jgi:hypothetical protein
MERIRLSAWLYQYVRVIEKELPRMNLEIERLNRQLA